MDDNILKFAEAVGMDVAQLRAATRETGWRNISSMMPSGWVGTLAIMRAGKRVSIIGTNLRPAASGTTALVELPLGFRPTRKTNGVGDEAGAYRPVFALNYAPYRLEVRGIAQANSCVDFGISFETSDAWPSSLPGTPI